MLSRPRVLWLLLFVLTSPIVARASDEAVARQHFERGKALVKLGEHKEAIKEFELAYQAYPRPSILYNLAHEHEVLAEAGAVDEMRKAVEFYQKYLESQPRATDRKDVEASVAELKARIESAEAKARELPVQTLPPPPAKAATEDSPHSSEVPAAAITATENPPPAGPKKSHAALWVGLGVAGGVVVVGAAIGLGVGLSQSPTPPASDFGNMGG